LEGLLAGLSSFAAPASVLTIEIHLAFMSLVEQS
jgi:hypothetical protein